MHSDRRRAGACQLVWPRQESEQGIAAHCERLREPNRNAAVAAHGIGASKTKRITHSHRHRLLGTVPTGELLERSRTEGIVTSRRGGWWSFCAFVVVLVACAGKERPFADEPYVLEGTGAAGTSAAGETGGLPGGDEGPSADDELGFAPDVALAHPAGAVLGSACARDQECASGFCVDNICCDTRCSEVCATCTAPGSEGVCGPASSDLACGALTCAGGTECRGYDQTQLEQNCSAFGQCRGTIECASLDQPEGTPCQGGEGACNGLGECVVQGKALLGATCAEDVDCSEGHCVARPDGTSICCDSACDGVCQQCSAAGRCAEAPAHDERCAAVDCPDDNVCRDYPDALTENLCRSFGQCRTTLDCPANALRVASGCECTPGGSCNLARGQVCTTNAECGVAACLRSISSETICCAAACGGGLSCSRDGSRCVECEGSTTRCEANTELRCDGDSLRPTNCANGCTPGVGCNAQAPVGFRCESVECQSGVICQSDVSGARRCCSRDCAAEGKVCAENGSCVCPEGVAQGSDQRCLLQLGEPCGAGTAQCETGLTCVDGVCCAEACGGACESCNLPGSVGSCTYAAQDASRCAAGEQCVARGQCRLGTGGVCAGNDARCVSNSCEPQLNGNGASICCGQTCNQQRPFCSRDGTRCVQCEAQSDCPNGCQNGACLPRRALGEVCDVASQCDSGICTRIAGTNTSRCCGQCSGGQVCNASGGCECPPNQVPVNGQCRRIGGQTCQSGVECQSGNCEASVDGANRCCSNDCGDPNLSRCAQNGSGCIDQRGGIGAACTVSNQCQFGNCIDGVCCSEPCTGACERCNAPGQAGQCVADVFRSSCGNGQQCFGRGQCRAPIGGNCATTLCGDGLCIETTTGGPLVCCSLDCSEANRFCAANGNSCVQCANDNDCEGTQSCDQSQCIQEGLPPEAPCTVGGQPCATPPCIETYLDTDGDGFALESAVNNVQTFCTRAPPGRTSRRPINQQSIDCCDVANGGADFRPNQTVASATAVSACARAGDPNGFDRNCSGSATSPNANQNRVQNCNDATIATCTSRGGYVHPSGCGQSGDDAIPACGSSGCIGGCNLIGGVCSQTPGGPSLRTCF
jgi:hypothetical protein